MRDDPYLRLGLHRNPFVAEDTPGVDEAVRLDVGVPDPPPSGVIELVGCKGAGKTTHLMACLQDRPGPYRHVDPGLDRFGRFPMPEVGGTVAWDEVDRVPSLLLRIAVTRARRRGALVLLGTHRRTGLADHSHVLPGPTATTVRAFAVRRIEAVLVEGTTGRLDLPEALAADIARRADGCWWTVGTELHRWAAARADAASPAADAASHAAPVQVWSGS